MPPPPPTSPRPLQSFVPTARRPSLLLLPLRRPLLLHPLPLLPVVRSSASPPEKPAGAGRRRLNAAAASTKESMAQAAADSKNMAKERAARAIALFARMARRRPPLHAAAPLRVNTVIRRHWNNTIACMAWIEDDLRLQPEPGRSRGQLADLEKRKAEKAAAERAAAERAAAERAAAERAAAERAAAERAAAAAAKAAASGRQPLRRRPQRPREEGGDCKASGRRRGGRRGGKEAEAAERSKEVIAKRQAEMEAAARREQEVIGVEDAAIGAWMALPSLPSDMRAYAFKVFTRFAKKPESFRAFKDFLEGMGFVYRIKVKVDLPIWDTAIGSARIDHLEGSPGPPQEFMRLLQSKPNTRGVEVGRGEEEGRRCCGRIRLAPILSRLSDFYGGPHRLRDLCRHDQGALRFEQPAGEVQCLPGCRESVQAEGGDDVGDVREGVDPLHFSSGPPQRVHAAPRRNAGGWLIGGGCLLIVRWRGLLLLRGRRAGTTDRRAGVTSSGFVVVVRRGLRSILGAGVVISGRPTASPRGA